jgi:hypothetical protein
LCDIEVSTAFFCLLDRLTPLLVSFVFLQKREECRARNKVQVEGTTSRNNGTHLEFGGERLKWTICAFRARPKGL